MKPWAILLLVFMFAGQVWAQETATPYPTATFTPTATYTPTPVIYQVITLQAPGAEESQNAEIQYSITAGQIGIFGVLMMLVLVEAIRFVMEWWKE